MLSDRHDNIVKLNAQDVPQFSQELKRGKGQPVDTTMLPCHAMYLESVRGYRCLLFLLGTTPTLIVPIGPEHVG